MSVARHHFQPPHMHFRGKDMTYILEISRRKKADDPERGALRL